MSNFIIFNNLIAPIKQWCPIFLSTNFLILKERNVRKREVFDNFLQHNNCYKKLPSISPFLRHYASYVESLKQSLAEIRHRLVKMNRLAFFVPIPKRQTPMISRVKCFLWDFLLSTLCVYSHRQWFAWPISTISLPLSVARIYRSPSLPTPPTLSLTNPPCSRGGKQRTLLPSGSSHWFSTLVTLPVHHHHPLFLHLCFCLLSTPRAHAVTRSHATNTCSCLPLRSYGRGDDAMHSTTLPFNHKNIYQHM